MFCCPGPKFYGVKLIPSSISHSKRGAPESRALGPSTVLRQRSRWAAHDSRSSCVFKGFSDALETLDNNSRQRGNTCGVTHLQRPALLPRLLRSATAEPRRDLNEKSSANFHLPNGSSGPVKPLSAPQSNESTGMSRLHARCLVLSTRRQRGRHLHKDSRTRWCDAQSAADPRCVPRFTPSLPESTDGAASSSSSSSSGRMRAHGAASCCCTTAARRQSWRGCSGSASTLKALG